MDVREVGAMLDMINSLFYTRQFTETERKAQLKVWSSMFAKDDAKVVMQVLKRYIATERFPPTIADIRKGVRELTLPSPEELIKVLDKAGKRSLEVTTEFVKAGENGQADTYSQVSHAQEAYCSLPPILQKYVKDPKGLQHWYRYCWDEDSRVRTAKELAKLQEETDIQLMIEG